MHAFRIRPPVTGGRGRDGGTPESIFCLALAALLVGLALTLDTPLNGDGLLYLSTLEALARHGSPAIDDTVRDAVAQLTGVRPTWLTMAARDGREYPLHFFFYALLCLPARLLLSALGHDPLAAFQLTNAVIAALAVAWLLMRAGGARWVRWGIAGAFLMSAGAFYLPWWHPELMTAAAVAVGAVALLRRRHPLAAGMFAIGALQNPSVALALAVVLVDRVASSLRDAPPGSARIARVLPPVIACLPPAAIALLPYAWSWWKFRAANPIAASGFVDLSRIGVDRALSFLFDLNQGAVVGLPLLLWLVPAALVLRAGDGLRSALRRRDLLLVAFALMVLPTLAHVNWNSGQSVFMRYASWSCMALVVWAFDELDARSARAQALAAVPALMLQAALVFHTGGARLIHEAAYSYVLLKPWVPVLWARAPHLYNPDPEIFFERVLRKEAIVTTPVVYRDASGTMLKALVRDADLGRIGRELCGEGGSLVDAQGGTAGLRVHATGRGLHYVTGRMRCVEAEPGAGTR